MMARHREGGLTPRPLSRMSQMSQGPPQQADPAAIRELLDTMKGTLGALGQTFDTLNEQSNKVSTLGPTMHDTAQQIITLRRQIRAQDKKQDVRIQEVKRMVRDQLKIQIAESMKAQIQYQIKTEVAHQVAEQVASEIKDHLPVSLEDQITDSKKQFGDVKFSLINSEARRTNSVLRVPRDLGEPLAPVLKPNSTKSNFFPADLRTLFSYDLHMAQALVRDFELPQSDVREINLNKFMSHIGIQFSLVVVPVRA